MGGSAEGRASVGPEQIGGLTAQQLEVLAPFMQVLALSPGEFLFEADSSDDASYFLRSGELLLESQRMGARHILSANSPAARNRVAHQVPRVVSASARVPSEVVKVDSSRYESLLSNNWLDFEGFSQVNSEEDWVDKLLQHRLFQTLEPSTFESVINAFVPVAYDQGDTIFCEGDAGDCFYLIESGAVGVERKIGQSNQEQEIATLRAGDAFGEAALISNAPRNATIFAKQDLTLMRLTRNAFEKHLGESLVQSVSARSARTLHERHGARWLSLEADAALAQLVGEDRLTTTEVDALRSDVQMLDRGCPYIVSSRREDERAIACFVLSEKGFTAYGLSEPIGDAPFEAPDAKRTERPRFDIDPD